jgi:hypothetical protein
MGRQPGHEPITANDLTEGGPTALTLPAYDTRVTSRLMYNTAPLDSEVLKSGV